MNTLVLDLDECLADRLAAMAAHSHKPLPEWAAEQLTRIAYDADTLHSFSYTPEWKAAFGSISDASFESPLRPVPRPVDILDSK